MCGCVRYDTSAKARSRATRHQTSDPLQPERSPGGQPERGAGPRADGGGRRGQGVAGLAGGLALGVGDLPAAQQEQGQGADDEHAAGEDLRAEEVADGSRGAVDELHGDGLGEGGGHDEGEEDGAQDAAELDEPGDLGQHGAHGAPERPHRHADQQRERDQHRVAVRRDPDREAQERANPRHRHRHVDAPDLVAVVPDHGPPDAQAEVEHGLHDGALRGVQPDRRGVRGQAVEQGDVAQLRHEAPAHDEQDLDAAEVVRVERSALGSLRALLPLLDQQRAQGDHGQAAEAEDSVRPHEPQCLDEPARDETVGQSADTRSRCGKSHGQASVRREPVRQDLRRLVIFTLLLSKIKDTPS